MFKKKVLFFLFLFLVGTVLAWTPPGDINLQNYYDIIDGVDANFAGNVTASLFKGIFNFIIGETSTNYLSFNGTQLDFDESVLNATIDSRAVTSESDPYWSANYSNYLYNLNNVNWTSLTNYPIACPEGSYVTQINDSITCTVDTQTNSSYALVTEPLWTANYTLFNSSWSNTFNQTTNDTLTNYILYVNGTNTGSGVYDDTWINTTIDSKDLIQNNSVVNWVNNVFATITNLNLKVSWTDLWNQVYNKTEVNDINTSMKNYVDWVNSTNGVGGETNWNANWTDVAFTNTHETFDENVTFAKNITTTENLIISNGTATPHWNIYEDANGTLVWEKL